LRVLILLNWLLLGGVDLGVGAGLRLDQQFRPGQRRTGLHGNAGRCVLVELRGHTVQRL
jgi:hypothetical protein